MANPTPTPIDYCRARGDTFAIQIKIENSAGGAIDIAGFSFLLTVDPSDEPLDDVNNVYQLTGTIDDAPNGLVSFAPSVGEAAAAPGDFFYDIQQTDAGSLIRTIAKGEWQILQDITK